MNFPNNNKQQTGMTTNMPEELLISRLKAGETQAYKYFFWEYCDYINVLSHSLLNSHEDANTVMREVLHDVWVKRKKTKLRAPLRTFLYQEVYHKSLPYLEAKKNQSFLGRLFGW
jgi:RNA polymerase sigma-70 factor, ECF subfamily